MNTILKSVAAGLLSLAGVVASPSPTLAQVNGSDTSAVIAAMQSASSGNAWTKVRSLHVTASLAIGGQQARVERWEDLTTGRYLVRTKLPTYVSLDGFDGVTSWHQGRSGISYTLGDVDAALVAADESFRVARGWWFPDRHPATMALAGTRSDHGRNFDVVDVTPEGGRLFEAWIDRSTHRLDRTIEQQAEDHVVTTYSDYRSVGGLMLPFTVRTGDGADPASDEVETVGQVEVDHEIPDSLFSVPPRPRSDIELPPGHDSVEVPFRLTRTDRIMVPITVNGRKTVEAEFDSGGSLILQPKAVAELGIVAQGRSRQGGGGEGTTTATNGRIDAVSIGNATVHDLAFHSFATNQAEPDKAIIGLEMLQRFVVRFDFDQQIITLTRPSAFSYRGTGAVIPFHFQDNQPEIKGSIDGIAGLFAIDTGDSGSLLLIAPFARRYGLVERYHADLPYGGTAVTATSGVWARKRVQTVAFFGPDGRAIADTHGPITRISLQQSGFDANRNVSANIGVGILKQFNLTLDYTRQQIILEPNHLYSQQDVFNRTGLRLRRSGDAWLVIGIYPGTPASDAGIRVGDKVVSLDGKSADVLSDDEYWEKLEGPLGRKLDIALKSAGVDCHVTLELRELL